MDFKRVAVVSGASQGMGLETVRQLALLEHRVYLTARSQAQAEAAIDRLDVDRTLVRPAALDVTDAASIDEFIETLIKVESRVDVLVNNAGVMPDDDDHRHPERASVFAARWERLEAGLAVHAMGPLRLMQRLAPIMARGGYGRIVNVSSSMASLTHMSGGWPGLRVSKCALNALTRIFADELKKTNVKVNAVCPGWVRTKLGGPDAERSVEAGVETTIWLATLDDDGPTGGFFQDRTQIDW